DRQAHHRHRAEQDDDDRQDRGEDRPVDEVLRQSHGACPSAAGAASGAAAVMSSRLAMSAGLGSTGMPGKKILAVLVTAMRSPAAMPSRTTRYWSTVSPRTSGRIAVMPWSSTV